MPRENLALGREPPCRSGNTAHHRAPIRRLRDPLSVGLAPSPQSMTERRADWLMHSASSSLASNPASPTRASMPLPCSVVLSGPSNGCWPSLSIREVCRNITSSVGSCVMNLQTRRPSSSACHGWPCCRMIGRHQRLGFEGNCRAGRSSTCTVGAVFRDDAR